MYNSMNILFHGLENIHENRIRGLPDDVTIVGEICIQYRYFKNFYKKLPKRNHLSMQLLIELIRTNHNLKEKIEQKILTMFL
jgi:hypothetical protein